MNLREKIKSYSFWVSLGSAIILILKVLGSRFGFKVDETMISDLFTALCSILVILGIIVIPQPKDIEKHKSIKEAFKNCLQEPEENELTNHTTPETKVTDLTVIEPDTVLSTNSQETPNEEHKTPEIEVQIEEEHVNAEPMINEANIISEDLMVQEDIPKPVQNYNELFDIIRHEKEKYSDNMAEFIKILQDEINSVKSQEEANF